MYVQVLAMQKCEAVEYNMQKALNMQQLELE